MNRFDVEGPGEAGGKAEVELGGRLGGGSEVARVGKGTVSDCELRCCLLRSRPSSVSSESECGSSSSSESESDSDSDSGGGWDRVWVR